MVNSKYKCNTKINCLYLYSFPSTKYPPCIFPYFVWFSPYFLFRRTFSRRPCSRRTGWNVTSHYKSNYNVYEMLTPLGPTPVCSALTAKGPSSFLTSILAARVLVSLLLATQILKLATNPADTGPTILSNESEVIL